MFVMAMKMMAVMVAVCSVHVHADTLSFLVVGDWGGQDTPPYSRVGEVASSVGMAEVAENMSASFVLALGDNFYYSGIDGDDTNFRFNATFNDVYTEPSLQMPWYLIAGNHDHGGNVTAQIAYSQRCTRWNFPDLYYSMKKTFVDDNGRLRTVQILMLDTIVLAGNNDHNPNRFMQPPGPTDIELAESQWTWLEKHLKDSTADYLWVAGHYPVWSACDHGPTQLLVKRLRPLLAQYNATGYLSGHDHCLEYLEDEYSRYVLSGAGVECCYNATQTSACPAGSVKFIVAGNQPKDGLLSGFVSVHASGEKLHVYYHAHDGRVIYTAPPFYPRKTAKAI